MVGVVTAAEVDLAPVAQARDHDEDHVEGRIGEREHRPELPPAVRAALEGEHRGSAETIPQKEAPRVPQEDARAREVVGEEAGAGPRQRQLRRRHAAGPALGGAPGEGGERDGREPRHHPVHVVEEVDRVHERDQRHQRERGVRGRAQVEVRDGARGEQERRRDPLAGELDHRLQAETVVPQPDEQRDQRAAEQTERVDPPALGVKDPAGERSAQRGEEDAGAPQQGRGRGVELARLGVVEITDRPRDADGKRDEDQPQREGGGKDGGDRHDDGGRQAAAERLRRWGDPPAPGVPSARRCRR